MDYKKKTIVKKILKISDKKIFFFLRKLFFTLKKFLAKKFRACYHTARELAVAKARDGNGGRENGNVR